VTRVVGIDASLTGTAIVVVDHDEETGETTIVSSDLIETKGKKDATLKQRYERLSLILNEVFRIVTQGDVPADLIVIEAPSYGSNHGHAHDRSGLWWLIVNELLLYDMLVAMVSPQGRAKYATGKGNAGKDVVLASVVRNYPDFEVDNNNVADAVVLVAMGCRYLGLPLEEGDLSQQRLDAMSGAAWMD
jgi:crossover junction endodeoxyribonuclease RuvC